MSTRAHHRQFGHDEKRQAKKAQSMAKNNSDVTDSMSSGTDDGIRLPLPKPLRSPCAHPGMQIVAVQVHAHELTLNAPTPEASSYVKRATAATRYARRSGRKTTLVHDGAASSLRCFVTTALKRTKAGSRRNALIPHEMVFPAGCIAAKTRNLTVPVKAETRITDLQRFY